MNREQLLAHRIMQIPGHTPALFKYRTLRCLFLLNYFLLAEPLQNLHLVLDRIHHDIELVVHPGKRLIITLRHPHGKIALSHLQHVQIKMVDPALNPLSGHVADYDVEQHNANA
ncbi:hypothetical protein D3C81_1221360 [compost metagenome]